MSGFGQQPVGKHTLEKFIPDLMYNAGVPGYFTLHSLRATCATRLYERGFPEQQIQEITGHSSNAVREYKRTSDGMKKAASSALLPMSVPNEAGLLTKSEPVILQQ